MAVKDAARLAFLRTLPCAVFTHPKDTGIGGVGWATEHRCDGSVEAHHRTGSGLALKAPDDEAFPLCRRHHREFHDASGLFAGWSREERKTWQATMAELYKPDEEVF